MMLPHRSSQALATTAEPTCSRQGFEAFGSPLAGMSGRKGEAGTAARLPSLSTLSPFRFCCVEAASTLTCVASQSAAVIKATANGRFKNKLVLVTASKNPLRLYSPHVAKRHNAKSALLARIAGTSGRISAQSEGSTQAC